MHWPRPSFFSARDSNFPLYLADIDAVVDRPGCLETFHHALLQRLGQPVHADEVLQVLGAGVVERAAGVHPLDDGGHVAKDNGVHQRYGRGGGTKKTVSVSPGFDNVFSCANVVNAQMTHDVQLLAHVGSNKVQALPYCTFIENLLL